MSNARTRPGADSWNKTACILCSINCGLKVQTKGRRITKIIGDKEHPVSKGYVCEKARRMDWYQNAGDRLTSPMRRTAEGDYEAVDWETAIREITGRLNAVRDTHGGDKILYRAGRDWKIGAPTAGDEGEKLDLSGLRMKLDPRAEWAQMFHEAWRIGRDWFYDDAMHGVDWEGMKARYGALVPHVAHRSDLDFIFGEMVGELEAGRDAFDLFAATCSTTARSSVG